MSKTTKHMVMASGTYAGGLRFKMLFDNEQQAHEWAKSLGATIVSFKRHTITE